MGRKRDATDFYANVGVHYHSTIFPDLLIGHPIGGFQERVLEGGPRLGAEVLREGRGLEVPHVVGSMLWGFQVERS